MEVKNDSFQQNVEGYIDKHPALKLVAGFGLFFCLVAAVALINGIVLAFELLPLLVYLWK